MAANSPVYHPEGARFFCVRREYMAITGNDACSAVLLDILEYYTRGLLAHGLVPEVRKSHATLAQDSLGLYQVRSIRYALEQLRTMGFLAITEGRKHEPNGYRLQVETINRAIRAAFPQGGKICQSETAAETGKICQPEDNRDWQNLPPRVANFASPNKVLRSSKNSLAFSKTDGVSATPTSEKRPKRRTGDLIPAPYVAADFSRLRDFMAAIAAQDRRDDLAPRPADVRAILEAGNSHPVAVLCEYVRRSWGSGDLAKARSWALVAWKMKRDFPHPFLGRAVAPQESPTASAQPCLGCGGSGEVRRPERPEKREAWASICAGLLAKLGPAAVESWFSRCAPVQGSEAELVIGTPDAVTADVIRESYNAAVAEASSEVGFAGTVAFVPPEYCELCKKDRLAY